MKLHVLGCAGGIGGRERHTTCLMLDHDLVLDAGTGLCTLDIESLAAIDHVFLTHFHLDHVAGLALMVDAVQGRRSKPVTVHASAPVIDSLKRHLFNWELWPDFSVIPDLSRPALAWSPVEAGRAVEIGGRTLVPHAVNHTHGALAYFAHAGRHGFLFTGDMASTPALWQALAGDPRLEKVIVDCSFPNAEAQVAERSMHFCPASLIEDVRAMPASVEFLIYHLKPGQEDRIMEELHAASGGRRFAALACGDRFEF